MNPDEIKNLLESTIADRFARDLLKITNPGGWGSEVTTSAAVTDDADDGVPDLIDWSKPGTLEKRFTELESLLQPASKIILGKKAGVMVMDEFFTEKPEIDPDADRIAVNSDWGTW